MSADLLFEIGCEEVPARFLETALAQLREKTRKELQSQRIEHGEITSYGTPRRLALAVYDVALNQQDTKEKRLGPLVSQAYDENGNPTKAAQGFARSCGADVAELQKEQTPKGEKLVYIKDVPGKASEEALAESLPRLVKNLEFPKSMRWGNGDMVFARPIHWLLALFGEKPVSFKLGSLQSDTYTFGHRFTHPGPLEINSIADYLESLDNSNVIADPRLRKEIIEKEIARLCSEKEWEVYPDPDLLEETANLVEFPKLLAGKFDERFLKLPPEVLIAAARMHQKSFSVRKPGTEKDLLPYFLVVANNPMTEREDAEEIITKGNQRVLAARLADAEFYWQEDVKTGLEKMREATAGMIFYKGLGSYLDKTDRLGPLCEKLSSAVYPGDEEIKEQSQEAARFCKADLVSRMVGEFAELQGAMGREYALVEGKSRTVAEAIGEHYLPRSAEDINQNVLPRRGAGIVLALSDKLDSIVACWSAGLIPTGSGDPFALRRQAQGIINIITGRELHLDLDQAAREAARLVSSRTGTEPEILADQVMDFVLTRFRVQMTESGQAHDVVDAIISAGRKDLLDACRRIRALGAMKKRDDFEDLMIAFRRVMNIVEGDPGEVRKELLKDESESVLFAEFEKVEQCTRPFLEEGNYSAALESMAALKPSVDRFFDEVMVNVDDEDLRLNRHALCARIAGLFKEVADFSKVVVEGDRSRHKNQKGKS